MKLTIPTPPPTSGDSKRDIKALREWCEMLLRALKNAN